MIHGVIKYQLFGQGTSGSQLNDHRHVDHHSAHPDSCGNGKPDFEKSDGSMGTFSECAEMAYEGTGGHDIRNPLGGNARRFINYIGTIFVFILFL